MVGKFEGILVGYRTYDKAVKDDKGNKTGTSVSQHVYDVYCEGVRKDKATGLFADGCKVISVIEEEDVLPKKHHGMQVQFYGETKEFRGKDGNPNTRIEYSGIVEVTK